MTDRLPSMIHAADVHGGEHAGRPCALLELTDTTCCLRSDLFAIIHVAAWKALLDWVEFHGIDPKTVPMCSPLHRDVEGRAVVYTEVLRRADGTWMTDGADGLIVRPMRAQGETAPLPWPAELLEVAGL